MTASAPITPDDAARTLDMLDAGHFDTYMTAAARKRLRLDALRALDRVAEVVAVAPANRRGGRTVVVICPYCTRRVFAGRRAPGRHVHGWALSDGDTAPGWRLSHCVTNRRAYYVPAPTEAAAQ
jgi:hypothetical protein